MARRGKKRPNFKASTEARRQARVSAGTPPAERIIPDKRDRAAKHKRGLKELLNQD
jgi:hypothetical protein